MANARQLTERKSASLLRPRASSNSQLELFNGVDLRIYLCELRCDSGFLLRRDSRLILLGLQSCFPALQPLELVLNLRRERILGAIQSANLPNHMRARGSAGS